MKVEYRRMVESDLQRVAQLHAESWRVTYTAALSAEFRNGPLEAERLSAWLARAPYLRDCRAVGWIAEGDAQELLGFSYAILHADAAHGHLLDNLHVAPAHHRAGLGRRLLAHLGVELSKRDPSVGVYLWVYASNEQAQAFYRRCGATCLEPAQQITAEGRSVAAYRYAWWSVLSLLDGVRE